MGVGTGGEEGEHGQQAAAPGQRDEDVMCCRAAEDQRPFGADQGVDWRPFRFAAAARACGRRCFRILDI